MCGILSPMPQMLWQFQIQEFSWSPNLTKPISISCRRLRSTILSWRTSMRRLLWICAMVNTKTRNINASSFNTHGHLSSPGLYWSTPSMTAGPSRMRSGLVVWEMELLSILLRVAAQMKWKLLKSIEINIRILLSFSQWTPRIAFGVSVALITGTQYSQNSWTQIKKEYQQRQAWTLNKLWMHLCSNSKEFTRRKLNPGQPTPDAQNDVRWCINLD